MIRNRLEIVYEVLRFCQAPKRLTNIINGCNLNYHMALSYLEQLKQKRMVESHEDLYLTTNFGRLFLDVLSVVLSIWSMEEITEGIEALEGTIIDILGGIE